MDLWLAVNDLNDFLCFKLGTFWQCNCCMKVSFCSYTSVYVSMFVHKYINYSNFCCANLCFEILYHHATIQVYLLRHTINHMDKYYMFASHFGLNTCSAGDNYAHAQTVDTRLFFSLPTKSLGMRLVSLTPITVALTLGT